MDAFNPIVDDLHPHDLHEQGLSKIFSVVWKDMTANKTCLPYKIGTHRIVSVQVAGNFSARGKVRILASNEGKDELTPISDPLGSELEVMAPSFISKDIDAEWIAPEVSGDSETLITVILRGRK